MSTVKVFKGRTKVLPVSLGRDVSASTFTSEIREGRNKSSTKIAEWTITKPNGGQDGELIFTLDDDITAGINVSSGYMDIKEVSGGEPTNPIETVLEVIFEDVITE